MAAVSENDDGWTIKTPKLARRCQSCGGPGAKKHGRRWRCDGCWKFSQPKPPKVTR